MSLLHLDDSHPLFSQCMDPYRTKNCIYLQEAEVNTETLQSKGTFAIKESCYIDDTGHFNAAEFIICYNQLMYVTLATAVSENHPKFADWTMEDWWKRQLPNVLIQETTSRYSRPINAQDFHGEFTVDSFDESRMERNILKLNTDMRFGDAGEGRAYGKTLLALTDVPR